MTHSSLSPQAQIHDILGQGRRVDHTLPGGGTMVWHTWGSGTPIVLLHGGHGSWAHWVRNVLPLSGQHAVWAADLPGFGESDNFENATDADGIWTAVAHGVQTITNHAGGAHLVGFSFGSMVAGFIAAERPELARSLTLVGAAAVFGRDTPLDGLVSLRNLRDPAEIQAAHRQNLRALMLHHEASIDELALYIQSWNVPRDRMPGRKLANSRLLQTLQSRWQCPVQGIWGQHDVLYDDDMFQRLPTALGNCDLRGVHVLPEAGHWAQYEAADTVNRLVLEFVNEVE